MADHNELGKAGEEIAKKQLIKNGFIILQLNYRFKRDEVDIIAAKDDLVIFIEVKTRANDYMGQPEEAVTRAKQKRIIKVAHQYLIANDLDNEARFDIFGIILNQEKVIINHIEDAFVPKW